MSFAGKHSFVRLRKAPVSRPRFFLNNIRRLPHTPSKLSSCFQNCRQVFVKIVVKFSSKLSSHVRGRNCRQVNSASLHDIQRRPVFSLWPVLSSKRLHSLRPIVRGFRVNPDDVTSLTASSTRPRESFGSFALVPAWCVGGSFIFRLNKNKFSLTCSACLMFLLWHILSS